MRDTRRSSGKSARWVQLMGVSLLGMTVALAPLVVASAAHAAKPQPQATPQRAQAHAGRTQAAHSTAATPRGAAARPAAAGKHGAQSAKNGKMRVARGGGLQCVPFARDASGIEVAGNAHMWWDNAAGVYARGQVPEAGSVLSFRANRSMPLGHVAVVRQVVNARTVEIDHANWAGPGGRKGGIARGVSVVDVSENNDWTAVRVALGNSGDYGSIYPTNGFIYDRPDRGGMVVAAKAPAPVPELNSAPRDLRPADRQSSGYASVSFSGGQPYEEVAEAPATPRRTVATRRKPTRTHH